MLKPKAFAYAIALVTGIAYVAFYLLSLIAPRAFTLIFNAQFFGANIASLVPTDVTVGVFIATLLIVVATAWILGYLWALLYNRFAK